MGASVTLRDLIPLDVALELTLTGHRFPAAEALDMNPVTHIEDDPLKAAHELASQIASRSPSAVAAAERVLTAIRYGSEQRALRREHRGQFGVLTGANQREAMPATQEKREARFGPR